jgi:hypothetical protein
MPTSPADFFQRYVLQQYRNTVTEYYEYEPTQLVQRYWFELQLSSEQYASLVAQLPLNTQAGDVPLLGALLYYNVNSTIPPSAYAVVWWYSTQFRQATFSAASFPISNWPTDFDPNANVTSSQPVTLPEGVEISTTASFYESSESLPSCHVLKLRVQVYTDTTPPTYYQNVFHPVNSRTTIQSAVYPPDQYNTQSDKNTVLSTSASLKTWIALNKAYIASLPYPLSPTTATTTNRSKDSFQRLQTM